MTAPTFRRSRLHDEKGRAAPLGEVIFLPLVLIQALARKLFGVRPDLPLVPRGARRALAAHLTPRSVVVEFGSGHSTVWLARHAGRVISHETETDWHDLVTARLAAAGLDNARVIRWDAKTIDLPADLGTPDLIVVDGHQRVLCTEWAIRTAGPNTAIYLDNSDKDMHPPDPDRQMRVCERLLRDFAEAESRKIEFFTGFAPGQIYAEEGMLVFPRAHGEGR